MSTSTREKKRKIGIDETSDVEFEYKGNGQIIPKDVVSVVKNHLSVIEIEEKAFQNCNKLEKVMFNEGLKKIGGMAFDECHSLQTINLPSTLTDIDSCAFRYCRNLKRVEFNEGLQKIGRNSFYQCNIESINCPSSLLELGSCAFQDNVRLKGVVLNNGLRKIGFQAFANCNVLQSIHLPSTVNEIDQYAFQKCSSLRTVMLNEGLQKLGKGAFDSCTALERVTISSTIKEVDDYAFKGCGQLREVVLNEGIKMIKKGAFQECTSLETFSLPFTLKTIGNAAFCNCTSLNLRKVLFHSTFFGKIIGSMGIGFHAFRGCTSLERFEFPSLSSRLSNIIKAGQSDIESKINEMRPSNDEIRVDPNFSLSTGYVQMRREGTELFLSAQDVGPVVGEGRGYHWNQIGFSVDCIDDLITLYEFKESTVLFELALWKARIDQADDTSPSDREACRIEVPGPVKETILQCLLDLKHQTFVYA